MRHVYIIVIVALFVATPSAAWIGPDGNYYPYDPSGRDEYGAVSPALRGGYRVFQQQNYNYSSYGYSGYGIDPLSIALSNTSGKGAGLRVAVGLVASLAQRNEMERASRRAYEARMRELEAQRRVAYEEARGWYWGPEAVERAQRLRRMTAQEDELLGEVSGGVRMGREISYTSNGEGSRSINLGKGKSTFGKSPWKSPTHDLSPISSSQRRIVELKPWRNDGRQRKWEIVPKVSAPSAKCD